MGPLHTDDLSAWQEQFVRGRAEHTPLQFVTMGADENDDSERAFDERAKAMIIRYQKAKGMTNAQMADFLSGGTRITEDNYISYVRESRPSKFPAYLIWRFCLFTGLALDGVPAEGKKPKVKKAKRRKLLALIPRPTGTD